MPARIETNDGQVVVREDPRTLPVAACVDVVVLGGGVAGLAAALAAAETGSRVLIIERGNCLGGTATAGMMALFYTPYRCAHGIPKRIFDRLIEAGGAFPGEVISFDHEVFKSVAFEMVTEQHISLLLHTICADVIMQGNRVCGLVIENKGTRSAVLGKMFVDASGDADIAARAGARLMRGRDTDQKMRPMSLLFRIGGIGMVVCAFLGIVLMPPRPSHYPWRRWIDTSLESPDDIRDWPAAPVFPGRTYRAGPRSVVVLITAADIGSANK